MAWRLDRCAVPPLHTRAYASLAAAPLNNEGRTALRFLIQAIALRALAAQAPAGELPGKH